MSITIFLAAGTLALCAGYAIFAYNRLVNLKHAVAKAWANIDVLLKQRHDELPKLVETCKQYMRHEQLTLERVMQARAGVSEARKAADVRALGRAETSLRQGLGQLLAVAEAYPDLKANASFRSLEARITSLETAIADRREYYNESVNTNNVRQEEFPDLFIARLFGFQPADLLDFSPEDTADVDIQRFFAC
jgi:LemA protein